MTQARNLAEVPEAPSDLVAGHHRPHHAHRRVLARGLTLALTSCALLTSACSAAERQLRISSANDCIERQCRPEQGRARQECTTLCMQGYGPK